MAITGFDPTEHGGAAFGDMDYQYLTGQGHSDADIQTYLQENNIDVSKKYREMWGMANPGGPNAPSHPTPQVPTVAQQQQHDVNMQNSSNLAMMAQLQAQMKSSERIAAKDRAMQYATKSNERSNNFAQDFTGGASAAGQRSFITQSGNSFDRFRPN